MKNLKELVRPNIWNLKPYSSARDEYKGVDATVFLDANESPYNAPINRYPDPLQVQVKELLVPIKGVASDNIFLGNGSDEAIDLVYRIFCEPGVDNVVSIAPTYGMYEVCADINGVEYRSVLLDKDEQGNFVFDADKLLKVTDSFTKVLFLCSPNNPTGACLKRTELYKVLNTFEGMVVMDEAYADFMEEPSFLQTLSDYPRLIVLQTFSKAWASAGIRLGMAFASSDVIALFNKVKYPYNVNVLTQREAIKQLHQYEVIQEWIQKIKQERSRLIQALTDYSGTEHIYPTDANFVLIKVKNARNLYNYLLTCGIIVRNRSHIQLCDDCLRITVGTPAENNALLDAMNRWNVQ